ncbi:hypothetical protein BC827DRAFT_1153178 [Russula dissimulans]|nr:hypothetical protein BC827DRAFT_1153178 [Russula dissimulans]
MSTSNQAHNASSSKFTTIFQTAYDEYKRLTGQDLNTHPFSDKLDRCRSPDDISNVLREKAQELTRFREGDKLLESLNPIVHVLSTFSGSLGECVGLPFPPARAIFISIGALLGAVRDIVASYDTLLSLFERIHLFLQRLNCYNGIPVTTAMLELLGKIMAQVLSILALSTKVMRERRISKPGIRFTVLS